MIKSFGDKETKALYCFRQVSKKLPRDIQERARKKLRILNAAKTLNDLNTPPGNQLEALKKERKGQHSIRINDQWRICFNWHETDACDVEITDYHYEEWRL
ncbi:MAG: type II toxin-antitoxin system RelE/ParE family toxin [Dehalococcoidia bacterium]